MSDATTPPGSPARTEFMLSDERREVLHALEGIRGVLKESQDQFARRLGWANGSTWSKIAKCLLPGAGARGNYFEEGGNANRVFPQLIMHLRRLRRDLAEAEAEQNEHLMLTDFVMQVLETVQAVAVEPRIEERRLIIVLAEKGQGKTRCVRFLKRRPTHAKAVDTRPAWTTSYRTALLDTGAAMDLVFVPGTSSAAMETEIVTKATLGGVLCFDEGEYFGKPALDLIKLLSNKTGAVVVLFMRWAAWKNLEKQHPEEAAQLQRRATFIDGHKVDPVRDVVRIAELHGVELTASAANHAANWANKAAYLSTLVDVLKQLKRDDCRRADVAQVDDALAKVFGMQKRPFLSLKDKNALVEFDGTLRKGAK